MAEKQNAAKGASEAELYNGIVRKVKAKFAEKPGHTGQEVSDEIARRWAKSQGRKFTPAPKPLAAEIPKIAGSNGPLGGDGREPGKPFKIQLPDEE